jgi:hypothetical protein
VYQTRDYGNTWSGPTVVAESAQRHFDPWMSYSPGGVLGLMWRTNQPGPGPTFPYNVWAAISYDGGAHFSGPLEVSHPFGIEGTNTPAPAAGPFGTSGDCCSFIALDHEDAFVAWTDWRPGEASGFFSAIKLEAFTHP